ncbi:MAG: hypothetical protein LIO44_01485, partial [Eubacterium sp.]|nr:hypothetical protein [Eubacterium sp.]
MIKFLNRQVPEKAVKRRFEDVYSEYNVLMSKYIYKRIQNKETSDSLTSDVFFKAFKNYENYDPEKASEKTWLFCIANNVLKNHYRDKKITEPLETCENSLSAAYENDLGEAVYYQ